MAHGWDAVDESVCGNGKCGDDAARQFTFINIAGNNIMIANPVICIFHKQTLEIHLEFIFVTISQMCEIYENYPDNERRSSNT